MNHVFVDFENVHQVDLSLIGAKAVSFTLMVGAKQTKLDSDLVERLLAHSATVQLVKLKGSGKNALDFALAYYLGRAALADPTGYFHVVSKDGGFDPLLEHLRDRHIHVYRHASCAELTFSWPGKKAAGGEATAKKAADLSPTIPVVENTPRVVPENHGKPWTPEEDKQLLSRFHSQVAIEEIARKHKRGVGGVHSRLVKHGKVVPRRTEL
jgi:hypothetical protein